MSSTIYSVFNETYMRLWSYSRKFKVVTNPDERLRLESRTLPAIIRQDEMICIPSITRSYDMLAYLLALLLWTENSDYQISVILNHFLRMARRYKYEGSWKIWFDLAEYFEVEVVEGRHQLYNEQRSRSSSGPNGQNEKMSTNERSYVKPFEREATIFSYMNFVEFLEEHFSQDDIFGNIFRRSLSMAKTFKIIDTAKYQRVLADRTVKRTIRHRGYRDKGTLLQQESRIRKEANRELPRDPEPLFDTLNQVIDWGIIPEEPSGGGQ